MKSNLKKFKIFSGINDRELDSIAKIAREVTFDAGQRIFEEKALAANFYLILEGKIEIRLHRKDQELVTLDEIGPGELFGWSSVAAPYTFTAATYSVQKSRIIVINGSSLRDLFEKNNHIGYRVIKQVAEVIARRLKATQARLVDAL